MLKILIIKTSSLGDVVHMLPAIYDAAQALSKRGITWQVDWVVEEAFQEVPRWSPYVNKVIPIAIRRWRKALFSIKTWQEIKQFKQNLQSERYDVVIDSQGLLKSAWVSCWAKGNHTVWGYDKHSIREPLATRFYAKTVTISRDLHAISRNRLLLAKGLQYQCCDAIPLNYGIAARQWPVITTPLPPRYIVALHGTSRVDKEWPVAAWLQLLQIMQPEGVSVVFPWGNKAEKQRVQALQNQADNAVMLPRCRLSELANILLGAEAVIGMDTGLMHVAAALNKQGIALYPVTQVALTGVLTGNTTNKIENISGKVCKNVTTIVEKMRLLITTNGS
jgi:heptosyltransferase-1